MALIFFETHFSVEMKKLDAKMKQGNYFSALKIIQLIRHEHLASIRQFHFAGIILSKFQNYKQQIGAQSTKEFTSYLESVQVRLEGTTVVAR